jgi:hypothetical protein
MPTADLVDDCGGVYVNACGAGARGRGGFGAHVNDTGAFDARRAQRQGGLVGFVIVDEPGRPAADGDAKALQVVKRCAPPA